MIFVYQCKENKTHYLLVVTTFLKVCGLFKKKNAAFKKKICILNNPSIGSLILYYFSNKSYLIN